MQQEFGLTREVNTAVEEQTGLGIISLCYSVL